MAITGWRFRGGTDRPQSSDLGTCAEMHGAGSLLNRTFAEVCASQNAIETVSLSRRNNCHSRQATNGQRRYSCKASSSIMAKNVPLHGRMKCGQW